MQTFLTRDTFKESAKDLDYKRLGKQRVEAYQILNANRRVEEHYDVFGPYSVPKVGWKNHPAVLMWRNYDNFLAMYGIYMCKEWVSRGYKDTLEEKFFEVLGKTAYRVPYWWAEEKHKQKLINSHRNALVLKDSEYYSPLFPDSKPVNNYYWPELSSPPTQLKLFHAGV